MRVLPASHSRTLAAGKIYSPTYAPKCRRENCRKRPDCTRWQHAQPSDNRQAPSADYRLERRSFWRSAAGHEMIGPRTSRCDLRPRTTTTLPQSSTCATGRPRPRRSRRPHTDDEVRESGSRGASLRTRRVAPDTKVWLAESEDGALVGLLVLDGDWLDQLYVEPCLTRRGIGTELIGLAKRERRWLRLWTFESNAGARRFYERDGFRQTD